VNKGVILNLFQDQASLLEPMDPEMNSGWQTKQGSQDNGEFALYVKLDQVVNVQKQKVFDSRMTKDFVGYMNNDVCFITSVAFLSGSAPRRSLVMTLRYFTPHPEDCQRTKRCSEEGSYPWQTM